MRPDSALCWILLLTALISGCGSEPRAADPAPALGARSAYAFTVLDREGTPRDHLLTGITGPDMDLHPDAANAARAGLDQIIAGQTLALTPAGDPDRYNRQPVQAQLPDGRDVAAALVEAGWAITWPRQGQDADFQALHGAEARAREANAGAWASGAFTVFTPDPNILAQHLDSAVIIEGRIISTGEGRNGRVYLNFGLDWRNDATISASQDVRDAFAETGLALAELDGTVVQVRGWLRGENGPMISLFHRDQLRLLDAPSPTPLP